MFHINFQFSIFNLQSSETIEEIIQTILILQHHLTRLRTHGGTYHTSLLQLVHQSSGTVIADGKLSLDE